MNFTKEERHALYVQALIESEQDLAPRYGLCIWISWAYQCIYGKAERDEFIDMLPEIIKHKPWYFDEKNDPYWFDPYDKQIRIDILKQAIKETE